MHSQHKDWQIAQSRDCFCDFGRKLVNLRLPAYFTVMFCHGWQNKAASSHGGLVVAVHVTLPQSNPGRLRFSYFRTTEQNRHGFVQFVNQQSCMHYLTSTSSYHITASKKDASHFRKTSLTIYIISITLSKPITILHSPHIPAGKNPPVLPVNKSVPSSPVYSALL